MLEENPQRNIPKLLAVAASAFMLTLHGCSSSQEGKHTGGLAEIESAKKLRVIVRREPVEFVPRSAFPVTLDRSIASELAHELGVRLELIVADDYDVMMEKLLGGEADVIAASMTVTEARKKRVAFSTPYLYTDELLITRTGAEAPSGIRSLKGRDVCVKRSSPHFETLLALNKGAGFNVFEMPETLEDEKMLDMVSRGECYATVADSRHWEAVSGAYANLAVSITLAKDRAIALAMRPNATKLKRRINGFLTSRALAGRRDTLHKDDLDGLKRRKVLRMITRNNAMTYYIYRGTQVGFEYELIKRFAESQGLRLEIVVPPRHKDMIAWLNEGRGDVVAAAMTITAARERRVAFTVPYNHVEEVVVAREDNDEINGPLDLEGKTLYVRKSSSFYETLMELRKAVRGIKVGVLPEDMETEEILAGVDEGRLEATVADSNLLDLERSYGRPLKAVFSLRKTVHGWAVRNGNEDLLAALNEFIASEHRGLFYNTLKEKYFSEKRTIDKAHKDFRSDVSGKLSPYDDIVKKYSDVFGLDWRLVVAQMFQESSFDPGKVSWAGAMGLMQLMPGTAGELGIEDLFLPESSIKGGTAYLAELIGRFDASIPLRERIRFALAAYNVGYNHLTDARRLAERLGYNPNIWFGNVEMAMVLLQKPSYYMSARYGYCRGSEPVAYVREIQTRYNAYVKHVPG